LAELVRTGLLPRSLAIGDRSTYHRALMRDGGPSPASRYRRLSEDIMADAKLIGPFSGVARRVLAADEVRLRSFSYVRELSADQVRHATGRVAENRCLIAWVRFEAAARSEAFRYALDYLVIEAPQAGGVGAERALAILDERRGLLETLPLASVGLARCGGLPEIVAVEVPSEPAPIAAKN
jgi:hypothetical protein